MAHPLIDAAQSLASRTGGSFVSIDDLEPGDIPLRWEGKVVGGFRLPSLHNALTLLFRVVEREIGVSVHDMTREQKQRFVHALAERGAFTMRGAGEKVAALLGVTRFTVYNYLNAIGDTQGRQGAATHFAEAPTADQGGMARADPVPGL
jgi:HTH domain